MVTKIKSGIPYEFDLYIRTFVITVISRDQTRRKYLMQGSETAAKNYAKELGRDFDGTARINEITLGK